MFNKYLKKLVYAFFCLAALGIPAFAQDDNPKLRIETRLVNVNVLVTDKDGKFVKGLKPDNFEIYDNNVKQPIGHFSAENTPVIYGVVYDMHPTTDDITHSVLDSLRQFSKELRPDEDIFMLAFNMNGMQKFDFIPQPEQLYKFLASPEKRSVNSLYDAVYAMADLMRNRSNLKQTILIISDSKDHASRHSFSDLRAKLKTFDTEIYAIIMADDKWQYSDITHGQKLPKVFTDASSLDRAAIQELALKSGGTYYSNSGNSLWLYTIYQAIASEMRSHYTIGFYPDTADGKIHNLRIRLRQAPDSRKYVLTYRQDYQIPK